MIAYATLRRKDFAVTIWYYSALLIKMQVVRRKNLHISAIKPQYSSFTAKIWRYLWIDMQSYA